MSKDKERCAGNAETPEVAADAAQKGDTWQDAGAEPVPENSSPEVETVELSEADKLKAEVTELQAKYLYLQAEYQNYRKRAARDIADARKHAVAETLMPFLTVVDFLGMAGSAAEKSDNLEALKQGLAMIIGEFDKALDELSVKRIETAGKPFDPELHEAMGKEVSETVPEGNITRQWSSGFKLGDTLLRPARVMVSAGNAAPGEAAEKEEQQ